MRQVCIGILRHVDPVCLAPELGAFAGDPVPEHWFRVVNNRRGVTYFKVETNGGTPSTQNPSVLVLALKQLIVIIRALKILNMRGICATLACHISRNWTDKENPCFLKQFSKGRAVFQRFFDCCWRGGGK
jgi:hypothetical protein